MPVSGYRTPVAEIAAGTAAGAVVLVLCVVFLLLHRHKKRQQLHTEVVHNGKLPEDENSGMLVHHDTLSPNRIMPSSLQFQLSIQTTDTPSETTVWSDEKREPLSVHTARVNSGPDDGAVSASDSSLQQEVDTLRTEVDRIRQWQRNSMEDSHSHESPDLMRELSLLRMQVAEMREQQMDDLLTLPGYNSPPPAPPVWTARVDSIVHDDQ